MDLGFSYDQPPGEEELFGKLPATLLLTCTSFLILIAVPLGMSSAIYRNRWIDRFSRFVAIVGASVPSFWLTGSVLRLKTLNDKPNGVQIDNQFDTPFFFYH
ncbi:ABC transporter permease subunit [Paenibacillus chartarius]|uniref:ABC transporter permease subunit n=1 Tax=Paenibacillus chartarius TaxID=747481 RepID=A0ABV6DMC8_9BACL